MKAIDFKVQKIKNFYSSLLVAALWFCYAKVIHALLKHCGLI